jgi:hypothetical protein
MEYATVNTSSANTLVWMTDYGPYSIQSCTLNGDSIPKDVVARSYRLYLRGYYGDPYAYLAKWWAYKRDQQVPNVPNTTQKTT